MFDFDGLYRNHGRRHDRGQINACPWRQTMPETTLDLRTAPYAALLLRVALGVMFIAHGLLKVVVFGLPGTVAFFESLGYPALLAYATILAEIGGGALLALGIWTRWVALALVPILIGATLAHVGNGWVFSAEGGGWEYPAFLIVASLTQTLLGDGAHALRPSPLPRLAPAAV
jgi:putative oxidoreductase